MEDEKKTLVKVRLESSPEDLETAKELLSPSIHKFANEFIYSGLSAVRQAHRPELIEGLSEQLYQ